MGLHARGSELRPLTGPKSDTKPWRGIKGSAPPLKKVACIWPPLLLSRECLRQKALICINFGWCLKSSQQPFQTATAACHSSLLQQPEPPLRKASSGPSCAQAAAESALKLGAVSFNKVKAIFKMVSCMLVMTREHGFKETWLSHKQAPGRLELAPAAPRRA